MPHPRNVELLAELLFRAEHHELGMSAPFERLPPHRKEDYRRKAQFLSARGVVVPAAVADELQAALAVQSERGPVGRIQETLERIVREGA